MSRLLNSVVMMTCISLCGCALLDPPTPPPPSHFKTVATSHEPLARDTARYTTDYLVTKPFEDTVHMVIQYQDLAVEPDPVRESRTLSPAEKRFSITSPALPAPKPYVDYEILLSVYGDAEHTDLLTTHRDWVRYLTDN